MRIPVEKEPGRIRRMFAEISPRYDLLNRLLSLRADVAWRRRAVRELSLPASAWVLDVCTGTADLALALAGGRTRGLAPRVVGSDFTPQMLRLGRGKVRRRNGRRVSLVAADTLRLPFRDESFDAVTVAFGIRNLVDLSAGLREMRRVLKPGGRVLILEFSEVRSGWLRRPFNLYFRRVLPRLGGWISGVPAGREAYAYLPASVGQFPGPEELSETLLGCGFGGARHVRLTFGVAAIHLATRPTAPRPALASRSAP